MNNLETLKKGYKDFAAGNMEAASAGWDKNIEWVECTGFPHIKGDGIFIGVHAVLEGVIGIIPENFTEFNIEIDDFVDGGDKIVMVGYYTGKWKTTGKKFKANATHTWTFKDGKAVRFFQAVDTAEIVN
jgi:ketosteroid isomerase-like protein